MTSACTLSRLVPGVLVMLLAACGGDEQLNTGDHVAASYTVLINDIEVQAPHTFTVDEVVRVRIKFFNAAQADLDDIEAEHFGKVVFEPASLRS
jgi:hypothetical protein